MRQFCNRILNKLYIDSVASMLNLLCCVSSRWICSDYLVTIIWRNTDKRRALFHPAFVGGSNTNNDTICSIQECHILPRSHLYCHLHHNDHFILDTCFFLLVQPVWYDLLFVFLFPTFCLLLLFSLFLLLLNSFKYIIFCETFSIMLWSDSCFCFHLFLFCFLLKIFGEIRFNPLSCCGNSWSHWSCWNSTYLPN